MKIFISQPMTNKTKEEVEEVRDRAFKHIQEAGHVPMSSWVPNEEDLPFTEKDNIPLRCLAFSIDILSRCDAVYFCKGWRGARGCRVERKIAEDYGLTIFDEELSAVPFIDDEI